MPDPTNETPNSTEREQILLAMATIARCFGIKESPALQEVPVHTTRPITLRDRVTLVPVEIVYGTEQPPVINVEDYAFFDPSLGEPWEDDSDA